MVASAEGIDPRGWYTASQAAEVLEMHRSTFYRLAKKAKLVPCVRPVNGRVVYSGKDLQRIVTNVVSIGLYNRWNP